MTKHKSNRGVALVTGASRRIGRAIALELASAGFAIGLHHGRSIDEARDVAREIERLGHSCALLSADLSDAAAAAALVPQCTKAIGAPVCLVNNASLFLDDSIETLAPERWDQHMAINLRAPILLSQAFARALPEGQDGNIVNIIDQRVWRPTPDFFSYSLSKSGLWSATQMLAQAFAPRIRVNAIGPGPILKSIHQTDQDFEAETRSTLLGRGATPEEIAAGVRFILDARSMTGQMIALDGGQHLSWRSSNATT